MSFRFRNVIVIGIILLLFIEFGYQIVQYNNQTEEESPINEDGKLKEGMTVSFEEEKELAEGSFPSIEEKEYADSMLYAFSQCLISAESIGKTSYICLDNNVTNEAISAQKELSVEEKGLKVYEILSSGKTITNVRILPISGESLLFDMIVDLDYEAEKITYEIKIQDRKITSLQKKHKGESVNEI